MARSPSPGEIERAAVLWPAADWAGGFVEERGDDHLILVPGDPVPGVVMRTARRHAASEHLPRAMRFLQALTPHVPFRLPLPLTPVEPADGGRGAAVVQEWVPGAPHPPHRGDPAALRHIVEALLQVPLDAVATHLGPAYSGSRRWDEEARSRVRGALPPQWRDAADAVWAGIAELDRRGAPVGLVHGDLAGHNMHWRAPLGESPRPGEDAHWGLIGILDWDHASLWDPAVNLAHLALWHGSGALVAAPDAAFAARAGVWLGHEALSRLEHATRGPGLPRRWDRLLSKTTPRLQLAAASAARL